MKEFFGIIVGFILVAISGYHAFYEAFIPAVIWFSIAIIFTFWLEKSINQ